MAEIPKISDSIYGEFKVKNPLMLELLDCPSMQRSRGINRLGVPQKYHSPGVKCYYQYEHGLGCARALEILGAGEEEQIAALLHDVSHPAFSHLVDWVFNDYTRPGPKEDFQDRHHLNFINSSEVALILEKYGYDPAGVAALKCFPLLDREIPELCIDRVDYCLRELPQKQAKYIFRDLTVVDQTIACKSYRVAGEFAREFLRLQREEWGAPDIIRRYSYFADILKRALEIKIIYMKDFWQDDEHILNRLEASSDDFIKRTFEVLKQTLPLPAPQEGKIVHKKFRHIDPLFLDGDNLVRLSEIDIDFKKTLGEARKENEQGVLVGNIEDL